MKQHVKRMVLPLVIIVMAFFIYALCFADESDTRKVISTRDGEFKQSKILGDPYSSSGRGKDRLWNKAQREHVEAQKAIEESLAKLDQRLNDLEAKPRGGPATPLDTVPRPEPVAAPISGTSQPAFVASPESPIDIRPVTTHKARRMVMSGSETPLKMPKGPVVVTFPVKGEEKHERSEVVLPVGSYVKAKLLTGVEAPEGTPYPVLLQLDFAHILPNKKTLDLRGCFIIAKAQGDLSTERVQMQATKLSCVAKDGHMFERDVNGFVADAVDNSFAVIGTVNTKQDRVAAMAFLSSVVDGVGKAIQMAQTTEQTSADGTSRRLLTGNQTKYIAAGGASHAAGMVAEWYLKQAQNLLPTINVGSGQDLWVVMNESVALPHAYFQKLTTGESHGKDYSFVNRLLD